MLASLPRYHFGLECMAKQGNMCLLASGAGAKDIAGQLQTHSTTIWSREKQQDLQQLEVGVSVT